MFQNKQMILEQARIKSLAFAAQFTLENLRRIVENLGCNSPLRSIAAGESSFKFDETA
jgi:hypothetical protein